MASNIIADSLYHRSLISHARFFPSPTQAIVAKWYFQRCRIDGVRRNISEYHHLAADVEQA